MFLNFNSLYPHTTFKFIVYTVTVEMLQQNLCQLEARKTNINVNDINSTRSLRCLVLHYCEVIFFWSSRILDCMLFTFEIRVLRMR